MPWRLRHQKNVWARSAFQSCSIILSSKSESKKIKVSLQTPALHFLKWEVYVLCMFHAPSITMLISILAESQLGVWHPSTAQQEPADQMAKKMDRGEIQGDPSPTQWKKMWKNRKDPFPKEWTNRQPSCEALSCQVLLGCCWMFKEFLKVYLCSSSFSSSGSAMSFRGLGCASFLHPILASKVTF